VWNVNRLADAQDCFVHCQDLRWNTKLCKNLRFIIQNQKRCTLPYQVNNSLWTSTKPIETLIITSWFTFDIGTKIYSMSTGCVLPRGSYVDFSSPIYHCGHVIRTKRVIMYRSGRGCGYHGFIKKTTCEVST